MSSFVERVRDESSPTASADDVETVRDRQISTYLLLLTDTDKLLVERAGHTVRQ